MRTLIGALVGLLVTGGIVLAVIASVGTRRQSTLTSTSSARSASSSTSPSSAAAPGTTTPVGWSHVGRAALVVAAFAVAWGLTGWPAAGVIAAALVAIVPALVGVGKRRDVTNARSEALAVWAEMLRDTIASHAGLQEALAITAPVAPAVIRPQVQRLAARAEHEGLDPALRAFAAEVADPVADLIVAALVIAAARQAQRLAELLAQIARAAREQAAMRRRVETGRARTYATARAMVAITFLLGLGMLLFAPEFMKPYRTTTGQLVLVGVGAIFAAALAGLVSLARPAMAPRLLAGIEDVTPSSVEVVR